MKKYIQIFYIFLFILCFTAGCKANGPTEPDTTDPSQTTEPPLDFSPRETEIVSEHIEITTEPKRYLYSFTAEVSSSKELDIVLVLEEPAEYYTSAVTEILVYDGKELIQTVVKEDVPEVPDYAWDGLFVNKGSPVGEPDVRDLNFDGADDFGLLAVETYPQHVPYSYFIWDPDIQQFVYRFTAFGMDALHRDEESRQLIETSYEGNNVYKKIFIVHPDGSIASGNQEINNNQ